MVDNCIVDGLYQGRHGEGGKRQCSALDDEPRCWYGEGWSQGELSLV